LLIKESIAYYKGRPPAFLLMIGLRVEGNGNEIPFLGSIRLHLPYLSADWPTPIGFFELVVFRYP